MAGQPTALVSASAEGRAQTEPRRGQIDAFYPAVRTWREFNSGPPIHFVGNFFPPRRSNEAQGERRSDGSVTRTMRTHPLAPEQTELRHSVHVLKVVGDFRAISKEASMKDSFDLYHATKHRRRVGDDGRPTVAGKDGQGVRTGQKVCMSGWAAFSPLRRSRITSATQS